MTINETDRVLIYNALSEKAQHDRKAADEVRAHNSALADTLWKQAERGEDMAEAIICSEIRIIVG